MGFGHSRTTRRLNNEREDSGGLGTRRALPVERARFSAEHWPVSDKILWNSGTGPRKSEGI